MNVVTLLMFATYIDLVAMQSVSWNLITDNPKCENEVQLRCTMSGFTVCCGSPFFRKWRKLYNGVTSDLVADGTSSDPSKYSETLDTINNQTTLTIKNFNKDADVNGIQYICQYSGATETKELELTGDDNCDCDKCAGECYGFADLGTVISGIGDVVYLFAFNKGGETKKKLMFLGVSIFLSLVTNMPIAIPIGFLICHCNDGISPAIHILVGIGTEAGIAVMRSIIDYYCNQRGKTPKPDYELKDQTE